MSSDNSTPLRSDDSPAREPLVAILTVLPVEHRAVRAKLRNVGTAATTLGGVYTVGTFASPDQNWRVALTAIGAGNPGAAIAAGDAISELNPDMLVFLGVAGGLKDVGLGDVAIASKVYGYERGKATAVGFRPSPDVASSHSRLVSHFTHIAMSNKWLSRLPKGDRTQERHPVAVVAPIAAGEKVIKSHQSQVARDIRRYFADAVAVEMEGMGILAAASYRGHVPAIVIRGISDLLDDKDSEHDVDWQPRASRAAAAMLFQGLATLSPAWLAGHDPERFDAAALAPELTESVFKSSHRATIDPRRQWSAVSIVTSLATGTPPAEAAPIVAESSYSDWKLVSGGRTAQVFMARHMAGDVDLGQVMIKVAQPGYESNLKSEVVWASKVRSNSSRTFSDLKYLEVAGQERLSAISSWLDGTSLAERIHSHGLLTLSEAQGLWRALARVLREMEIAGFAHGDIKPMNVIGQPGEWMLIDFGAAGPVGETDSVIGTPSFMPPEVFDRKRYSGSDIYSLALTVYAALTGVEGEGGGLFGDTHWVTGSLPDSARLRLAGHNLPSDWMQLIAQCLAPLADRPSVAELFARVEELSTQST